IAKARFWQPPGMPQVIWMACLPSVQVTIGALVSELRSGPGVVLGSMKAKPRTTPPRADARETMFSPPYYRWPTGHMREYLAAGGSYSVVARCPLENSMRSASAALLTTLLPASPAAAQPPNEQLAARCAELGAIFDRYGTRRSEGSGGPDMIRLGAGIDCQKGRYAQGIKALEDLLRDRKSVV